MNREHCSYRPETPFSLELEGGPWPAEVGSMEEVEAVGKRSDVDVDGCGSSKHTWVAGDDGRTWGSWGSSPRTAPEVSLVTWNTFSLLASVSTEGAGGKYSQGTDGYHRLRQAIPVEGDSQHTDPLYTHPLLLENPTYQRSLVLHLAFHLEIRRGMPRLKEINQIRPLARARWELTFLFCSLPLPHSHFVLVDYFDFSASNHSCQCKGI